MNKQATVAGMVKGKWSSMSPEERRAQRHPVRAEVCSWSDLDSSLVEVDRANPSGSGKNAPNAGITNLVQLDLGYSFIF